jgi:hypothetical protein
MSLTIETLCAAAAPDGGEAPPSSTTADPGSKEEDDDDFDYDEDFVAYVPPLNLAPVNSISVSENAGREHGG